MSEMVRWVGTAWKEDEVTVDGRLIKPGVSTHRLPVPLLMESTKVGEVDTVDTTYGSKRKATGRLDPSLLDAATRVRLLAGETVACGVDLSYKEATTEGDVIVLTGGELLGVHLYAHNEAAWPGVGIKLEAS
jgi:hypothetical protein